MDVGNTLLHGSRFGLTTDFAYLSRSALLESSTSVKILCRHPLGRGTYDHTGAKFRISRERSIIGPGPNAAPKGGLVAVFLWRA